MVHPCCSNLGVGGGYPNHHPTLAPYLFILCPTLVPFPKVPTCFASSPGKRTAPES